MILLCILAYFLIGVVVAVVCDGLGMYRDGPRIGNDPNRPLTIVGWPFVVLVMLPLGLLSSLVRCISLWLRGPTARRKASL